MRAAPIQLTDRDAEILSAVHRYRVLHRQHIRDQFFHGQSEEGGSARRRLLQLYEHGYLERLPRFGVPPMNNPGPAYRLAARGAALLAECEGVPYAEFNYWGKTEDQDSRAGIVGHAHLEHNLLLASVRMHFETEAPRAGVRIHSWLDSFDLRMSWKTERVRIEVLPGRFEEAPITPDAYLALDTPKGRGHFFIELDRGSETISRHWRRKALAYQAYLTSGKFHARYGVDPTARFRLLAMAPADVRERNIAAVSEAAGLCVWTTTTSRLLRSKLNARIWRSQNAWASLLE